MIIFIYGTDKYLVDKAAKSVLLSFVKEASSEPNIVHLNGELDRVAPSLSEAINSRSLFEGNNVIVAKDILFKKGVSGEVVKVIESSDIGQSTDVALVITNFGSEKDLNSLSKELFKILTSKNNKVIYASSPKGKQLDQWIVKEGSLRDIKISQTIARELINITGNDVTALLQEIEKLANYKIKGTVTSGDLADLVVGTSELGVFDLVDAIATKNKNKAYELLYKSLKMGYDPIQLMRPVIYQFRNLLMVKSYRGYPLSSSAIAKDLGIHPFVAQKTISQSQKFEMADLKRIYSHMASMDIGLKSGTIDPGTAFNQLLLIL